MQPIIYKCPNCSANISVPDDVQSYTCDYCGTQPTPVIADDEKRDDLYLDALAILVSMGRASTSVLQRRLNIGYGRATKILDQLYIDGLIGEVEGARPRKVLSKAYAVYEKVIQTKEYAMSTVQCTNCHSVVNVGRSCSNCAALLPENPTQPQMPIPTQPQQLDQSVQTAHYVEPVAQAGSRINLVCPKCEATRTKILIDVDQ